MQHVHGCDLISYTRASCTAAGHCVVLHSRWEQPQVAAAIIGAGPEPLQSQFATGYNMAANLLRTRSLEEARAFIERSFGNYLGASPADRTMSEPSEGVPTQRRCSLHLRLYMAGSVAHKQHEKTHSCVSAVIKDDCMHGLQAATAADGGAKRQTPWRMRRRSWRRSRRSVPSRCCAAPVCRRMSAVSKAVDQTVQHVRADRRLQSGSLSAAGPLLQCISCDWGQRCRSTFKPDTACRPVPDDV